MWTCNQCGQKNDDDKKLCIQCNLKRDDKATPEIQKGTATRTFQFSTATDVFKENLNEKPVDIAPAKPVEKPKPAEPPMPAAEAGPAAPLKERPIAAILRRQALQPRNWIILGSVVLGILVTSALVYQLNQWSAKHNQQTDTSQLEKQLSKQLMAKVMEIIPEKLEWGKEVLVHRHPYRFPEELILDVDKESGQLKYENDAKTIISYQIMFAYHYRETNVKAYLWVPAQFFFELKNGVWIYTGDQWVKESTVIFE